MKAKSSPKTLTVTSSKLSLVPPNFVLRGGRSLVSSHGSFFSQTLNENTNQAYANGIKLFCDFLTDQLLEDILDIEPKHVTEFVVHMSDGEYGVATTRLYLSAIRMFLDSCVVDGLISVNPAKAVKLPRQSSRTGKTPVIIPEQVRQILELESLLNEYIEFVGITETTTPLFQSSNARGGKLTGRSFDRTAAWRMVRRRAAAAGVHREIGNHSFRATGITTYLNAGGSLEDARIMANHSNATTTKLYDRTGDKVKIQEVNRIDI